MAYAAMTKGSAALYVQLLLAAELMGLSDHLRAEFRQSQPAVYQRMERGVPEALAYAHRWVSEIQEIEATFQNLGLTPCIFRGLAETYQLIGGTRLGDETPDTVPQRTLKETIRQLAAVD